ncbi:MAG: hypothetical protein ABSF70_08425 [Terracidiphilus sp.]|jgi:hypothetical protein
MGLPAFSRQDWSYGIFLLSAVVIFGNGIHYVLFRLLRKRRAENRPRGLSLQRYLAWPARGVFLAIGLRIILPLIPHIAVPLPSITENIKVKNRL